MTVMLPEKVCDEHVCWATDYCLRHCEGYRVCGPDGTVGYVEEVWLSPDEIAVEALLVRGLDYEKFTLPRELIEDIDPVGDRLWISEVKE